MNDRFVNVKVDREERPDLDSIYMTAVQALTGHGGWPMTVFLTPEGVPFYGGTYFPPEPRHGMPAFRQVLTAIARAYTEQRADVLTSADRIRRAIEQSMTHAGEQGDLTTALLDEAYRNLAAHFDRAAGGFGAAPKFPQAPVLEFLLRYHRRTGLPDPLDMVETTLTAMMRGGIFDQLAGGFHRYAVDRRWLVPHFEKMLYDNALLAQVYLQAYQLTGSEAYRQVTERTIDYVLADLRSPEGAFYCARDADSEGEEGRYYVWTSAEIDEILGREDAHLFRRYYDVTPGGNFEGRSILYVPHDLAAVARSEGLPPGDLQARLARAAARLLEVRDRRSPPLRDEKILTSWNGLLLRALADSAAVLGRRDYQDAAVQAAEALLAAVKRGDRILHVSRSGQAGVPGFLEDYAALADGLLGLYEATFDERWLLETQWLAARTVELFWDEARSVFYDAPADGEALIVRARDVSDNPTPSGNSLAIQLLARLRVLFGEERYGQIAEAALGGLRSVAAHHPLAFGRLLGVLDFQLSPPKEIAILGELSDPRTQALMGVVRSRYLPNRIVVVAEPGRAAQVPIPLLEHREAPDRGTPTAYVCEHYVCRQPVTEPEALAALLDERDAVSGARH
ncbi:MAG: thioredoxin domain-containing protein [Gemmatimonadetes bacterium]|nr:thioredoxin domain-containing protein [Gemmatimonadota bacterium]